MPNRLNDSPPAARTAQRSPSRRWPWALLLLGGAAWCLQRSARKVSSPGIEPVSDFDIDRYMGTWHEIARIDHWFQRGLSQCSATYTLQDDGTVTVVNEGYHAKSKAWRRTEGAAEFVGEPSVAALRVSFFGPFYSGYNVVVLDEDYQVAMVIGESPRFFWILARTPDLPETTLNVLYNMAKALGVDMGKVHKTN